MKFANREEAGRRLAKRLQEFANRNNVVVLGIPRGGVPIAYQIASGLHAPLDVFLSRKLGVPGNEELAFGAVTAGDGRYLDEDAIRAAGISPAEIEQSTIRVRGVLTERAKIYRGDKPALDVMNKIVILADDGIATGASTHAAIMALRQMKPAMIVLAVPVMPDSTQRWLKREVDKLVCLHASADFYAVGQFYQNFRQVDDREVITLLNMSLHAPATEDLVGRDEVDTTEVTIDLKMVRLRGLLSAPREVTGLVIFVHGSGSSRLSLRNHFVAEILQSRGLATLLFDLLTESEELVDQHTAQYRFDVRLLADRLIEVTRWIPTIDRIRDLPTGYFGASTGAAAALIAAAELPGRIVSIVSRGGRPDLAGDSLEHVQAAVLLMVGGKDDAVLQLNQQAMQKLRSRVKKLEVIPDATHLFEEEGALAMVARHAADWFDRTLEHSYDTAGSSVATTGENR